jgi:hypothetical protein
MAEMIRPVLAETTGSHGLSSQPQIGSSDLRVLLKLAC